MAKVGWDTGAVKGLTACARTVYQVFVTVVAYTLTDTKVSNVQKAPAGAVYQVSIYLLNPIYLLNKPFVAIFFIAGRARPWEYFQKYSPVLKAPIK